MNSLLEAPKTDLAEISPLDLTDEHLMAMLQQREPVALGIFVRPAFADREIAGDESDP